MNFERGNIKKSLDIGIVPQVIKMLKEANKRDELKSNLMKDLVILKIEETLGIKIKDITHPTSQYYMIRLKIQGIPEVIRYEFDVPF